MKNDVKKKKKNKNKSKKINFKEFFSSINFLRIVFLILLLLVVILSFLVYRKEKNKKSEVKANIVIPVMEFNAQYSFSIELKYLVGEIYVFKVTNFRNDDVNSKDVNYTVSIDNATESKISVSVGDNKKVIEPNTVAETDAIKLDKNEKLTDCYSIEIEEENDIKDDEKIQVVIASKDSDYSAK